MVAIANIRLQWPYSPESFYSFKKLLAYSNLFCPKLFYAANVRSHAAVTVCIGHLHLGIRLPIWMSISCPYAQCNYARHIVTYRKQMKPVHSCKCFFCTHTSATGHALTNVSQTHQCLSWQRLCCSGLDWWKQTRPSILEVTLNRFVGRHQTAERFDNMPRQGRLHGSRSSVLADIC